MIEKEQMQADLLHAQKLESREGVERITAIVAAMKNFSHPGSKEIQDNNLNKIVETTITVASDEWKYLAEIHKNLDQDFLLVSTDS